MWSRLLLVRNPTCCLLFLPLLLGNEQRQLWSTPNHQGNRSACCGAVTPSGDRRACLSQTRTRTRTEPITSALGWAVGLWPPQTSAGLWVVSCACSRSCANTATTCTTLITSKKPVPHKKYSYKRQCHEHLTFSGSYKVKG